MAERKQRNLKQKHHTINKTHMKQTENKQNNTSVLVAILVSVVVVVVVRK